MKECPKFRGDEYFSIYNRYVGSFIAGPNGDATSAHSRRVYAVWLEVGNSRRVVPGGRQGRSGAKGVPVGAGVVFWGWKGMEL
ncbi:MAG: hypothetical protein H7836_09920 [Magnetococcus sp. YQC-3]